MYRQRYRHNHIAKKVIANNAQKSDDAIPDDVADTIIIIGVEIFGIIVTVFTFWLAHSMQEQNDSIYSANQVWVVAMYILSVIMLAFVLTPVIAFIICLIPKKSPTIVDYRKLQKQNHIRIISINDETDEFLWPNSKHSYDNNPSNRKRNTHKPISFIDQTGKMQKGTICIDKSNITITPQNEKQLVMTT